MTINVKVASASTNQTIVNFTRNVPNIKAAIDTAVRDGADILSLQELGLTGYTGDDYYKWINSSAQQDEILQLVQEIADYANEKDPNLVVSLGFPFFYADKDQPVKHNVGANEELPVLVDNPLYNINNRPFNAVALLSGGKIHAISAKSIQPDGAAEYEPRQFASWPDYLGSTEITLSDGSGVPFGKVVAQIGTGKDICTIYHEICAEGWPGIYDDGTVNTKEQSEGRYIARLAEHQDISLIINPSASKPEPGINKRALRETLCATGSSLAGGAGYVYTNCLGLESGYAAFEGGAIFAENGTVTHASERYSMADVAYSSAVMTLPSPEKGSPHVTIEHAFRSHEQGKKVGAPAAWESSADTREMEEITRNTALWLRDYLNKSGQQGFFISLSGGADSAYGAVLISQMIELNIKEIENQTQDRAQAVIGFIEQFDHLRYKNEVRKAVADGGAEAGVECIKAHMLTCAYMPGDNSSDATKKAAQTLIEGGVLPDGTVVKGIGGTFHIANVQAVIDAYMEVFSGVVHKDLGNDLRGRIREEMREYVSGERTAFSEEVQQAIPRRVLSWNDPSDDLTLQNIQARARLPLAWLYGNDENKIACVTSNLSEAFAGYWTFGGDGHMGSINICGGVFKSQLRDMLQWMEKEGVQGLEPVQSLYYVNHQKASAELRPLKDGEIAQFDEDDMMPYPQLDAIARAIVLEKNSPMEAYEKLQGVQYKEQDLFRSKEELIGCIEEACWRWHASQFKRVASVITPFLGNNMDPHQAVRTTILSDGFQTGRAQLKLEYLKEKIGEQAVIDAIGQTGESMADIHLRAKIDRHLRDALNYTKVGDLEEKIKEPDFGKGAGFAPRVSA